MHLKLAADQPHQLAAVRAVADLFRGQPFQEDAFHILDDEFVIDNRLELDAPAVLENMGRIQEGNGITPDKSLESFDFSIEMETGTGKTYTYIRTMMELNRLYGWKKFLVVVPGIAIREGVLASLRSMEGHFLELYGVRYNGFEYDSAQLGQVRHFVRDDTVQIMVITLDAFKRSDTILRQEDSERFPDAPVASLARTRPIVILDEPQNMESDLSKEAIGLLDPLFVLRYSATHKNLYHLLYSLGPTEALERNLVKRIEVLGIEEDTGINEEYVSVLKIDRGKDRKPFAKVEILENQKSGVVKKARNIKGGDDLAQKSKNPLYQGYVVRNISYTDKSVAFENGVTLHESETSGMVKQEIQKEQIRRAVRLHMERYEALKQRGIKVLSLFFIDRVANYLGEEGGWIEPFFREEFDRQKADYPDFTAMEADDVYAHYFAKRTKGYVDELKRPTS